MRVWSESMGVHPAMRSEQLDYYILLVSKSARFGEHATKSKRCLSVSSTVCCAGRSLLLGVRVLNRHNSSSSSSSGVPSISDRNETRTPPKKKILHKLFKAKIKNKSI